MFTDKEHRGPFAFSEEIGNLSLGEESTDNVAPAQRIEANDKDLLLSTSDKEESKGSIHNSSAYSAPGYDGSLAALSQTDLVSLDYKPTPNVPSATFAIDDLLGLGLPAAASPPAPPPVLKLNTKAALEPNAFQQKWRQLPISLSQETSISPEGVATLISPQTLIHHMQGHSIHCIASGGQAPNFKFFFYAQKAEEPSTYLVECVVNSSSCKVQLKVKADDQSTSQAFSELFQSALSKFGFS